MWGCSRWPDCAGAINIDPEAPAAAAPSLPASLVRSGVPGGYAQARLERERSVLRLKQRAILPLVVGMTLVIMNAAFLASFQFGASIAAVIGILVGGVMLYALLRLPAQSLMWTKGVEGEQKAASYLEPLLEAGYVVLYNRLIPGQQGDIDAIVIGPTGVFTVETKNWNGKVSVRNDGLFVGEYNRTWVVAQIYREALAVQVTLGDELTAHRVTVTPILCAIGGASLGGGMSGGVYVVAGKDLARTIAERPVVFDDAQVQLLARVADQRLRLPHEWDPPRVAQR
jgi:hypothetical protein